MLRSSTASARLPCVAEHLSSTCGTLVTLMSQMRCRAFWLYVLLMSLLGLAAGISAIRTERWFGNQLATGAEAISVGGIFSLLMLVSIGYAILRLIRPS